MFPELNFAVVKLQTEKLCLEDLKRLNTAYKNDPNYSNIYSLLISIDKKCNINFGIKDLQDLAKLYNYESQKNNHRTIVWLVSQPLNTALTHMFVGKIKDNSQYCTTLEKAYQMLGLDIEYLDFLRLLNTEVQLHN